MKQIEVVAAIIHDPQFHLTMHCYLCHVESGHLELKEHEAAKWLNKDELESINAQINY